MLLGRLPLERVEGFVMQASKKALQKQTNHKIPQSDALLLRSQVQLNAATLEPIVRHPNLDGGMYATVLKAVLQVSAVWAGILIGPSFVADKYTIDPEHVYIHFFIQHYPWAKYLGAFHDIKGTILFDRDNVSASSVQAEIAAESVDTSNKYRDTELQAHGFNNGWEFPKITYESISVKKTGDNMGKVIGNLTMAGITVPVAIDVIFNGEAKSPFDNKQRVGFSATGKLSTDDFKMTSVADLNIGPEVNFMIEVEAPKD